jgi:hypothetical protein
MLLIFFFGVSDLEFFSLLVVAFDNIKVNTTTDIIVKRAMLWFHYFDSEAKQQSMEWHHLDSPTKKKPKTMLSAKMIMDTVWDVEGCFVIEF